MLFFIFDSEKPLNPLTDFLKVIPNVEYLVTISLNFPVLIVIF